MGTGVRRYRDLEVWQLGIRLVEASYRLTKAFPQQERYGLASQLQRAAVSVPANIAEGHGRDSTKQFLYHVSVAMGSICEIETYLFLAERFGYGGRREIDDLLDTCDHVGKMLRNLQKSLKAKLGTSLPDR